MLTDGRLAMEHACEFFFEELRPKINHTQTEAVPHTSCHHCTVQSVCQVPVALWGRAELQQVRSFLVQGHTCPPQPHHHQYVLLQHSCMRPAHCMSGNTLGPVWRENKMWKQNEIKQSIVSSGSSSYHLPLIIKLNACQVYDANIPF